MSWEQDLFAALDDLEQQAEAAFAAERAPEVADRGRAEYRQVTLAARLAASVDREVVLHVAGVGPLRGRLERVGTGWCLLAAPSSEWVVLSAAVTAVEGASERALPDVAWSPVMRLGPASALRRLGEAGERCLVHTTDGAARAGTVRRVGADFVEVDEGVDGDRRVVLVAFAALAAVRSD